MSNCAVLLDLIGQDWLEMKDAHGRRRLDDSKDFMRVEIEAALQRDVPVIPVLIGKAETPDSSASVAWPGLRSEAKRAASLPRVVELAEVEAGQGELRL